MSPTAANKDYSLDFLSDYYFNTKSPVTFTSPLALYREAKKRYPSLTLRQVKTWLQSKDTYTLHKPVRYNFPRNRITGIDDQWQADLVDVSFLARFNKGYKFLLTCIDVFLKFARVVPLKNKSGETLVNGFQSILDLGRSPEKLQTDKGTEFLNRNFQSLLKENSIHFFTTNSELKASMVEPRGGLIIFSHWVCHCMVSVLTLSGIFDEKVGPFSEFFAPNGGLQNTILRAVLGKNSFHFQKNFLKLWIFSPN